MGQSVAPVRSVWIILPLLLLTVFVATFDPNVNRWPVNFTWLAALLVWTFGVGWADRPGRNRGRDRKYAWPFVLFVPVFAALWLPFYDNWRWVQAGDSFPYFWLPAAAAKNGLAKSILSMRGVDDHFPYTSVIVDNVLMFIFGPTLFWHRASKFVISLLALLSIYTFFSLILEFPWALAVVIVTAATFHWQNFSHISFTHIDSFIIAYLALVALTLILREPQRRRWWLALGIVGGLSLFFTQTAWAEVAASALVLVGWAAYRRHLTALAICGLSFLIAATPAGLQLPDVLRATTVQTRVVWDWVYLSGIFRTILWLPCGKTWTAVEWNGYFAGWPCGYFYVTGLVLAALTVVPAIRRRLQLPPAVVGLLLLFLAETVVMTLTNNANSNPSAKRTYHLIPLQAFFALLPLYTAALAVRGSALAYRAVTGAGFLAVAAYALASASLFVYPERFGFGGNLFDGIVQMRQRFPDRKVLIFAPQKNIKDEVDDPRTMLNESYHVAETVSVTRTIDAATVDAACAAHAILCDHTLPQNREDLARAAAGHQLRQVDVFAVSDLQCFECK
ncbi:MAG: hypothetical protein ACHQ9S_18570 [Candidatus Binatia bacterium]